MRRKTLITAGFIIATVLQGISYPAIALADNGANTTEQESVSSSKSEQSYNSPENDNQNDSDTNAPSTSADNATSTTIDNKEDTRSTTDTTVQPKAEDDMDGTPADAPSSTPQNGWNTDKNDSVGDTYWNAALGGNWGNLHAEATYTKINEQDFGSVVGFPHLAKSDNKIWTAGADYTAGKWNVSAMYLKGDADQADAVKSWTGVDPDDDGYVFGLNYAGAENSKPGSWGLYAKYYDQSAQTVAAHTMNGDYYLFPITGFKGYMVGGKLAVAKNMIATVEYYDLKDKNGDAGEFAGKHARTLWSDLTVTF